MSVLTFDTMEEMMPRIILFIAVLVVGMSFVSELGLMKNTPSKQSYSIAIFGDSMEDTMGEKLEYLQLSLSKKYPNTTFNLYNYGIGSQNVEQGVNRFNKPFNYKTRKFVPISDLHPDIIIIGSYAYNPFTPYDLNKYKSGLSKLISEAKSTKANVYLLVEIAPLQKDFGKGLSGVNWPDNIAYEQSGNITKQLEGATILAREEKISLIDVYSKSKIYGIFNYKRYVNSYDGIHPSALGHMLIADTIVEKISLH